jgi:flagellar protein FlgJ
LGLADKIVEELAPKLPTVSKSDYKAMLNQGAKQENTQADDTQKQQETTPAQTTEDSLALRRLR